MIFLRSYKKKGLFFRCQETLEDLTIITEDLALAVEVDTEVDEVTEAEGEGAITSLRAELTLMITSAQLKK